jgi:hypothetical protein
VKRAICAKQRLQPLIFHVIIEQEVMSAGILQMAAVSILIWLDLASLTSPTNRRRLWTGVGRANSSPSAEKYRIFCHRDVLLLASADAWKIERLMLSM